MLRWLYLDLNSFFASVHQQLRPELRGRPVAVGPESVDSGTIIAASYEAKAFGVKTGMRVGEAKLRCPGLVFVGSGHDAYIQIHHKILNEVERHIPVTKVCSIDEFACRLLDNENDPAHALALAKRIKAGIARNVGECLTSSIGIAPTRLLAKIAGDMQKPDGLTLIEAHELPQRLYPLPLRDIPGVGAKMEARLAARGITTMQALLERNPMAAGSAWGSVVGARLWWMLHGHEIADAPAKSKSLGHSHVLAPQLRDAETVRLTARRLLLKAATRLRSGDFLTRHVTLHARFEDRYGWAETRRVAPTNDSYPLLEALGDLWPVLHQVIRARGVRVRTIGVTFDDIAPRIGAQGNLFEFAATRPVRTPALSAALDRLNRRFGRDTVTLGPPPVGRAREMGAKIAFGQIPERAEFHA